MRRRNCISNNSRNNDAARSFYKQHKTTIDDDYIYNVDRAFEKEKTAYRKSTVNNEGNCHSKSWGSVGKDNNRYNSHDEDGTTKSSFSSSFFIIFVRKFLSSLSQLVSIVQILLHTTIRRLATTGIFGKNRLNVDVVDNCVSCSKSFSILHLRWRKQCSNCLNEFCETCLNKQHEIFDGKSGRQKKPVCGYCFFTLCARHCGAKCCKDLPTKELKAFLARKGVSSRTALEKSDLIDLIHSWSLDLDAAAAAMNQNNDDDDVEAGGVGCGHQPKQQQEEHSTKIPQQHKYHTSYSASSEHLTINAINGSNGNSTSTAYHGQYSNLGVLELRHLLHKRGVDTSNCIEKAELVTLIAKSDGYIE